MKRVWQEEIALGWKHPSWAQALQNLMIALFYVTLHHNATAHPHLNAFDLGTIMKAREVIGGNRKISEEEYAQFEAWLKALSKAGHLSPTAYPNQTHS